MIDPNLILKPNKKKPNDIVILEAINENPMIHHNKLKKLVSNEMATATFDKTIKNLILNSKIDVTKFNDNKKHYSIPDSDWLKQKDFETEIRNRFKIAVKFVDQSLSALKNFKTFQMASMSAIAIKSILKEIDMLIMFESCYASTKYITEVKNAYEKKLREAIQEIRKEKDSEIIINYIFDDISGFAEIQKLKNTSKIKLRTS